MDKLTQDRIKKAAEKMAIEILSGHKSKLEFLADYTCLSLRKNNPCATKIFINMTQKDFFHEDDNQQIVTFQINEKTLMVNATEMAKIFDARINDFLSNQQTKAFIEECLKNGNSRFLNIKKESDLYTSVQKSGTWMHRILALKFAAWLSPKFELWVFRLIDQLLFADYNELKASVKESASRRSKIEKLKETLRKTSTEFKELETLEGTEVKAAKNRSRKIVTQIKMFQEQTPADEEE